MFVSCLIASNGWLACLPTVSMVWCILGAKASRKIQMEQYALSTPDLAPGARTCVCQDSHYHVSAVGEFVHFETVVGLRTRNRRLRRLYAVQLCVCTLGKGLHIRPWLRSSFPPLTPLTAPACMKCIAVQRVCSTGSTAEVAADVS